MSRTLAFATSSLVLAFSLGCSMGDSGSTTITPASADAGEGETCCCEYKEEGASGPSYSEMAQSNCESWGYACVDDDKCADGGDEAPADDGGEADADGEADDAADDAEEADAEGEEEEEAEAAPEPAPTRTVRPTGGTMTRGKTLSRDGGGSKTGGSSSGSASGGKVMKRR